jgi:hypothetical protein
MVAGMVAGDPQQGGATWAVLQYVLGLEQLGHTVVVVEPVDRLSGPVTTYFGELGLDRAALLLRGTDQTVGLDYSALADFNAELLVNISGLLRDRRLTAPIPVRLFLDLDPVFTQIWHAQGDIDRIGGHTHYATVGSKLAETGLPLGPQWLTTLPPVLLDRWRVARDVDTAAFTTVGHWRSYGSVHWRGRQYGQKAHAVRRLLALPSLTREPLRPALAVHPDERADLDVLAAHGWTLLDPAKVAATPQRYQRFVAGSRGELGLAKAGYVDARSGWFSDRSACYLASGRPVVAHDTGFGAVLPTGRGLLAFSNAREAATAIDAVCADYESHSKAAREIAEQHLDSNHVLTRLLERIL